MNRLLLLLMSVLLTAAHTPSAQPIENVPVVEAAGIARKGREVPVPQNKTDDQLVERLTRVLHLTGWFENLQVTSQEGVVTLSGRVEEESKREWAMKLAQDTIGVVAVINKIELKDFGWFDFGPTQKELKILWKKSLAFLPHFAMGMLIFAFSIFVFRAVSGYSRRFWTGRLTNPMLSDLMAKIGALPVLLIGFYLFLQVLGLTGLAFSILGGTGALGLIAGFAFKNILENYFSGVMLSLRRPFVVGDMIDVAGEKGAVFSMSSRGTTLVDMDGNHILIPNTTIFTSIIRNRSVGGLKRVHFNFRVNSSENAEAERRKVLNFIRERSEIASDPIAEAHTVGNGEDTRIDVAFWIESQETDAEKLKQLILGKMSAPKDKQIVTPEPPVKNETSKILERAATAAPSNDKNLLLNPSADQREF